MMQNTPDRAAQEAAGGGMLTLNALVLHLAGVLAASELGWQAVSLEQHLRAFERELRQKAAA